jgi:hypothetical protein
MEQMELIQYFQQSLLWVAVMAQVTHLVLLVTRVAQVVEVLQQLV